MISSALFTKAPLEHLPNVMLLISGQAGGS